MERKNPADMVKTLKTEVMALVRKVEAIDPREYGLAPLYNENVELAEKLRPKLEAYEKANEEWHQLIEMMSFDTRNQLLLRFDPGKKRLFAPTGSGPASEEEKNNTTI